jgi:sn-glycerol 3-phosphate transport system substrate-binding protein
VHVENLSAWHNEPFVAGTSKNPGGLAVNGLVQVKHLAMMSSWYKSRYMHVFGRAGEADAKFVSGECAIITTTSASFPTFRRTAKFDVGAAPLPYHDDIRGAPQNTIADGPLLWIAEGYKPDQYKVAAKFVSFVLTPEIQVEWQYHLGYLPLNRAGLFAASSEVLRDDLVNNRVAIKQLTNKPVTDASRSSRLAERGEVRTILEEELEAIWANKKPAKEALDTAVVRTNRACPRC